MLHNTSSLMLQFITQCDLSRPAAQTLTLLLIPSLAWLSRCVTLQYNRAVAEGGVGSPDDW